MITETIDLPVGISLDGNLQRKLTMREATTTDMLRAEDQVPVEKSLSFNMAQAGLQIVSIGELPGPFTLEEMARWNKHDVDCVMRLWGELEKKSLALVIEKNLREYDQPETSAGQATSAGQGSS